MATVIYLPSTGAAPGSPAYDSAWEDTSFANNRLRAVLTKISSAFGNSNGAVGDTNDTDRDVLNRQYLLGPLAGMTVVSQQVIFNIRALENNSSNNIFTAIGIRAVAPDFTTFRGTLVSVTRDGSEMDSVTATNRTLVIAASTQVVIQTGDYLVIEIGAGGDPAASFTHQHQLRIGDNSGTDLPDDNSTTTDNNPVVKFATSTLTLGNVETLEMVIVASQEEITEIAHYKDTLEQVILATVAVTEAIPAVPQSTVTLILYP